MYKLKNKKTVKWPYWACAHLHIIIVELRPTFNTNFKNVKDSLWKYESENLKKITMPLAGLETKSSVF